MAHLSLPNSHLITGCDYSANTLVNDIVADSRRHCAILYPGQQSTNLSTLSADEKTALLPDGKTLTVFVIDGTWATARKMMRMSRNLHELPRISFSPPAPSNFRVRKQPKPECYSTIEAIHHTIELLNAPADRRHDSLLRTFDWMVTRQLEFIEQSRAQGPSRYRRERERKKQNHGGQQAV
jgi:DTW domain-containing protein YfiP